MDDDLLTQMGLILTQLRYARRALEDIERSTARYAGFAFASALSAGPSFGTPPMMAGALKVHVININDLQPGTGFGGFLESLLGGVGRFFGGLIGGFVGGTISGFNLPGIILAMQKLADRIDHILTLLGISFAEDKKDNKKEQGPPAQTLSSQLKDIKDIVNAFTALFTAASNPDKAGEMVTPKTKDGTQWLDILKTVDVLVRGISRVVDGLILGIPVLLGGLASIVVHFRDIQLAVLDLLQFLLKEILLLRGVVLFTLWDTIGGAARTASSVLSILGGALQAIITSIGGIFGKVFDAGLSVLKFLAEGLSKTVDTLLKWLVDAVGTVLLAIGDSKVFRVAVHLIQVLPAVLPPLVKLVRDTDINPTDLQDAAKKVIEEPKFTGKLSDAVKLPPLDLGATLAPQSEIAKLGSSLGEKFDGIKTDLKTAFDSSIGALNRIGTLLDDVKKDKSFLDAINVKERALAERSQALANSLAKAQAQLADRPKTGLETIAAAYESWLTSGGLRSVLDQIGAYFKESPATGALAPSPGAVERPRATVEIKELVIDITAPAAENQQQQGIVPPTWPEREESERIARLEADHLLKARGWTRVPGPEVLWG